MANKFYAIKSGRKTGIVDSWEECKNRTQGYPNAEYKSFKTEEEAQRYLDGEYNVEQIKPIDKPTSSDVANLYVDGSFKNGYVAFGVYMQTAAKDYRINGCTNICTGIEMRNITGELASVLVGLQIGIEKGFKKFNIIYDYQGIEDWVTGNWKCKSEITSIYKDLVYQLIREDEIKIHFIKVKGHSGVSGNTLADKLAIKAIDRGNLADFSKIFTGNFTSMNAHFIELG